MDIMCNIRTARSSPEHPLPATGIPMCQAQGCVSASLNLHHQDQPGGNVEQPQLMCKYDIIHKTRNTYHNISLCCLRRTEPRPWVTCTKNLVKIECMVGSEDMIAARQMNTHADLLHNTLLPYWGRSNYGICYSTVCKV